MAIYLIGGFRVRVGDQVIDEVDWPQRKPKAIVKMLALTPGHRLHRERVIDALWPELDLPSAGNNFRKALHRARATLAGDGRADGSAMLVSQGELIALAAGTWVDVSAFEAAASTARATRDVAAYRKAIDLCGGELLPEDRYEDWASSRCAEVREGALALTAELAAILEAEGDLGEAAALLRRALAIDPLYEDGVQALLRVLSLAGRRAEALAVYESFHDALERELGVEPDVATIEMHQEIVTRTEPSSEHTVHMWERIGDLRLMSGDSAGAAAALRAALALGDGPHTARLERKAARALLTTHAAGPAGEHLDRADAALERAPDAAEAGRVLAARAHWSCLVGDLEGAAASAEEARAIAEQLGDPLDVAAAYETFAIVCHYRGEWRDGMLIEIDRVGAAMDQLPPLASVFDIYHCIGQYHLYGDGLSDGVEDYARHVLEVAGRRDAKRAEAWGWCLLGEALMLRGRLDEAQACLIQSTEIHTHLGSRSGGLPWQRLGEVAVYRGDAAAASAAIAKGMAIATVSPMASHLWGRLYATSAFDALERGDPQAAIAAVHNAEAAAVRYGDCPSCGAMLHPIAAEAFASCGVAEGAARHAAAARRVAESFQSSAWQAMAETAIADAAQAAGDVAAARQHLETAADLYDKAGQPFWTTRTRGRVARLATP